MSHGYLSDTWGIPQRDTSGILQGSGILQDTAGILQGYPMDTLRISDNSKIWDTSAILQEYISDAGILQGYFKNQGYLMDTSPRDILDPWSMPGVSLILEVSRYPSSISEVSLDVFLGYPWSISGASLKYPL